MMPFYQIKPKEGDGKVRLVDAINQSQALRHVAKDAFEISIAGAKECFALGKDGVDVETAGAADAE